MNNTITIKAPAKINLFLEVNNKRNDGYHDLTSIMQTISLCDTLEVSVSSDENITVEVVDYPFLSNEHNISCIAARLFMTELGQNRGVKIWIEKKIPVVAGLAGGSADAALKSKIEKVYDLIHSSPSRSYPSVKELENSVMMMLGELGMVLEENNVDEANKLVRKIQYTMEERNRIVALSN